MCDAEISNGGFPQPFTNSTGELMSLAIESAEHFGLDLHAALLREAVEVFLGGEPATDKKARIAQWDALYEQTGDGKLEWMGWMISLREERWYALEDDLTRRLADFARGRAAAT